MEYEDIKTCPVCGKKFARPNNQHGTTWSRRKYCSQACNGRARSQAAWEKREARQCPICKVEFRPRPGDLTAGRVTCGDQRCKREYNLHHRAPKMAATMRADYASGKRKPGRGVSQRELMLWPLLKNHGFLWRLQWTDIWGTFEIDFASVERKLAIEIDGEEHGQGKRLLRDQRRDAELLRRGWQILRIPNADVDASPRAVARRIRAWSDSRGHEHADAA